MVSIRNVLRRLRCVQRNNVKRERAEPMGKKKESKKNEIRIVSLFKEDNEKHRGSIKGREAKRIKVKWKGKEETENTKIITRKKAKK